MQIHHSEGVSVAFDRPIKSPWPGLDQAPHKEGWSGSRPINDRWHGFNIARSILDRPSHDQRHRSSTRARHPSSNLHRWSQHHGPGGSSSSHAVFFLSARSRVTAPHWYSHCPDESPGRASEGRRDNTEGELPTVPPPLELGDELALDARPRPTKSSLNREKCGHGEGLASE